MKEVVKKQAQKRRDIKDIKILNKKADKFNREAGDVLSYQRSELIFKTKR